MHATYPVVIRHHPGWFGVFAGLILGVALTVGGLFALDRIDMGTITSDTTNPAAMELYLAQQAREYTSVPATVENAAQLYQAHQALEYPSDVVSPSSAALWEQFLREHRSEMTVP